MTQEVQPLTWSKRTNIEEHQQFFSKINEIIGNLAPTVDEAEQAIAQATAAIASANDAIATANAASAAASAAASQAQTAASTVAGYDARLTAAEGDIGALGSRMTAAETKNSQQDTAIANLQTADTQNVKINNINQYAIGLTGNQDSTGTKGFSAIKTPFLEIQNNFRPVIYYGNYDATDVQTGQRIRPMTVFASTGSAERPIFKMETIDDASMTGVELTTTIYNKGVDRSIAIYVKKSDGMSYVTAPSRGSTNVSDYSSNEVVTIDTLRKLGLIQ